MTKSVEASERQAELRPEPTGRPQPDPAESESRRLEALLKSEGVSPSVLTSEAGRPSMLTSRQSRRAIQA
jgi:hypothetical protein